MDTYCVTRIEEPDFGCEGRPEGQEIKDKLLYEKDINEGMKVVIDGDGRLQKAEDRS